MPVAVLYRFYDETEAAKRERGCQYTDLESIRIKYDLDQMRGMLSNHMRDDLG